MIGRRLSAGAGGKHALQRGRTGPPEAALVQHMDIFHGRADVFVP
jgi:hypothetical protein